MEKVFSCSLYEGASYAEGVKLLKTTEEAEQQHCSTRL